MKNRPYFNSSSKEIIQVFDDNTDDPQVISELAYEIQFRKRLDASVKKKILARRDVLDRKTDFISKTDLDKNQAQRGIYIDFEGLRKESPALLGILVDNEIDQIILDKRLRKISEAREDCRFSNLDEEIERLFYIAEKDTRKLIAYSWMEKNLIKKYCSIIRVEEKLNEFYLDAYAVARKWVVDFQEQEKIESMSLKSLSAFLGYPYPTYLGHQQAAARIRYVRDMIQGKERYQDLTPVAKAKWTKLLQYNQLDCTNTQILMKRIAHDYSHSK